MCPPCAPVYYFKAFYLTTNMNPVTVPELKRIKLCFSPAQEDYHILRSFDHREQWRQLSLLGDHWHNTLNPTGVYKAFTTGVLTKFNEHINAKQLTISLLIKVLPSYF